MSNFSVPIGDSFDRLAAVADARAVSAHRAALVRAVLGQQWAVAVALHTWGPSCPPTDERIFEVSGWSVRCAEMPCAVDVVAEMMGEVRS